MSKNDWINDQLLEVRRDLESWSESRRDVMRREVNSIGSDYSCKTNNLSPQDAENPEKLAR